MFHNCTSFGNSLFFVMFIFVVIYATLIITHRVHPCFPRFPQLPFPECRCTKPDVCGHMCSRLSTTTFGSGLDDDDMIDPERGLGIAVEVCGGKFSWVEGGHASLEEIMFNAEAGKFCSFQEKNCTHLLLFSLCMCSKPVFLSHII